MKPAARMAQIAPFHVMDVLARAQRLEAAGRDIVHLEVGEPDFPTAAPIVAAAQHFLADGHVHYTPALGLPALREAISDFYAQRYRLQIDPARIVITAGASGALLLALGLLVNPGDEWLLPDPGYPCNRSFVATFNGRPVALPVMPEHDYQPRPADIAAAWSPATRGLMLASPANPTGTVLSAARLQELHGEVIGRGGQLLVDEIYHGLTYGTEATSALTLGEDVFVINSFSKYFGMTGWRLGWLVAPAAAVRDIEKLAQNLFIAPSTIAQHAALAAFTPEALAILEARRHLFAERRNLLLDGLQALGFGIRARPQGAFYIYADCSALAADSRILADRLVDEAGVAATPGVDFGTQAPGRHLRFAYTTAADRIADALERMARFLHP